MVLAKPLRKTMVCSLRSNMSSMVKSKTLSKTAVSCRMPSFFSLTSCSFSIFARSSTLLLMSERAMPLVFERMVLCRQSSCLFRKPYWPSKFEFFLKDVFSPSVTWRIELFTLLLWISHAYLPPSAGAPPGFCRRVFFLTPKALPARPVVLVL